MMVEKLYEKSYMNIFCLEMNEEELVQYTVFNFLIFSKFEHQAGVENRNVCHVRKYGLLAVNDELSQSVRFTGWRNNISSRNSNSILVNDLYSRCNPYR